MNYNFVKETYKSIVENLRVDDSALRKYVAGKENEFILNHNINGLARLLRFLNSSDNVFILNGFLGAGKTYVADCFLDFISDDVLVFRNSYQEAINMDDILLSVFRDFTIYHNEKKVSLPQADSTIFSEKINTYIKYCDVPMLFIFDSFEINMRSKDKQKDILDFINYLSHFEKVKIVICSRTFKQEDLISQDSSSSYTLESLTPDEMFEYLEKNNIKGTKYECQELYRVSRGHYLLLELSALIMEITGISFTNFSSEYKKSTKNFLEFLVSKILSISSEKYIKLLLILTIIRHGVNLSFIINQNFASEEDVDFLMQKHVISEKFGKYYLKDYIKSEFLKSINTETKIRIHKYFIEVYEAELPLKPFDREMFLSRLTMRQEIDYHKKRIEVLEKELEQIGRKRLSDIQDFTYLSYSRKSGYEAQREEQSSAAKRNTKLRKDKTRRFELSNTDSLLLNASKPDDLITKHFETIVNTPTEEVEQKKDNDIDLVPKTLDEYIDIAQNYEKAYDFASAILYYKKALEYTDDKMFKYKEPVIYTKLAICSKRIQNTDDAVNYYEKVYRLYIENDSEKANEILLSIAQIHSEEYKFDKAKEVYKRILYSPKGVSSKMVIRVFLDLSELEDNNMDVEMAVKYAQKALSEAEKLSDTELLCECYFKYAALLDDTNNSDLALKYYLRCVQTSSDSDINEYLAASYSNMAEISFDRNNNSAAKMYLELSISADEKKNNFEGLYYSNMRMAKLLDEEKSEKAFEYLMNALSSAKKIGNISYEISAYNEIADYYLNMQNYKKVLKTYLIVRNISANNLLDDIKLQTEKKMDKIRTKIGEVEFLRIMNDIKNKK